MKKRTLWARLLCLTLAMAMCLSMVPVAYAAETTTSQVMVETEAGSTEPVDVTITIDTVPNPDGSTTLQTTTEATDFVTGKDLVVDYTGTGSTLIGSNGEVVQSETRNEYTVDDPDSTFVVEGGSESTLEQAAPDVELDIPLTDTDDPDTEEVENQNTQTTDRPIGTVIETTGDVKESEDDGEYDYTTSTVEKPGSTTVTTTDITITGSVDPENSDLDYVSSDTTPDGTNDLIAENPSLAPEEYLPGYEGEPVPPEETVDGYEFIYEGTGNTSQFRPAIVFTIPMTEEERLAENSPYIPIGHVRYFDTSDAAKDENGNFITDEAGYLLDANGERVIKKEQTVIGPDGQTYYLSRIDPTSKELDVEGWYMDGEWTAELNGSNKYRVVYATAQQFVLVDQDTGEVVTVYCADIDTPCEDGFGYNMENLEDADYYTEEQAEQIRAIALTGYWGTTGYETDADGNEVQDDMGNPIPKAGSLEALKATLLASGEFTEEELEALTDGVAMTATQMAIWSCSNHMAGVQFVNTHYVGSVGDTETDKAGRTALNNVPEAKEAEAKLMFKVYEFLKALEPVSYEGSESTANTIINEQNFLKDLSLTVLDKAEDHVNNQDTNTDNDAYVTNLTFALVVTPSTENGDDLVVSVVDRNGNVITSGRIAGEAREGETVLVPDAEGNYSFTGITLVEGEQNFNITLEGIQNLAEGVYLYSSEVRTDESGDDVSSQTLVGLASGSHGVNVSMNIEFDLSVEDEIIIKEHVWRGEREKPGDNPPPDGPKPDPVPPGDTDDPEDAAEPEEIVLAEPPKTGDGSLLYSILSALSGMGLSALQLLKKRKKPAAAEEVQVSEIREEPPAPPADEAQDAAQEPAAVDHSEQTQEIQREEVTAAAAASGTEVANNSTGRIAEDTGKEVMCFRPIAAAEHGAYGGNSPGIVSAPASGAKTVTEITSNRFVPGGGLRRYFRKGFQILQGGRLRLLSPPLRGRFHPVVLQ